MSNFKPLEIKNSLFPVIVFSDNATGLFSFLIRWRTRGMYNHSMIAISQKVFASQGVSTYKKIPFSTYMKRGFRLKFVGVNLSKAGKRAVFRSINEKLKKSKAKKRYDYLGIIGQVLGLKWIQDPWTDICSEDVIRHLKKAIPFEVKEIKQFLKALPDHGSPADINKYMKQYPDAFSTLGRWQWD